MTKQKTISLEKHKREIDKKDLVIGLLTEFIGYDKALEVLRANDYDLRALAIDNGKKLSQDQIDELRKTVNGNTNAENTNGSDKI